MNKTNALVIFAKEPRKDSVKTRLSSHLTDDQRMNLYVKLLAGTIEKLRTIEGVNTFLCYSPENAQEYFKQFSLEGFPQTEGDLGERMYRAVIRMLHEGYQKVVIVGVDIPDISPAIILHAFEKLNENDIVFGPAQDGGYYLVGLQLSIQEIFQNIDWSTDRTLQQSIDIGLQKGYSIALLEELSDIDTIEDITKREMFGLFN